MILDHHEEITTIAVMSTDTPASPYPQSHALVIAISKYENPLMAPLGEVEDNARALAKVLAGPPHNFHVRTLLGPNKENILEALSTLTSSNPFDRVLITFAGHALLIVDRYGNEQAFLALPDTNAEDETTALPLNELLGFWLRTQAKHVAFVVDAPVSASGLGITHTFTPDADPTDLVSWRAGQVLSAGANGRAITPILLSALETPDGKVGDAEVFTFSDLGVYVQQRLEAEFEGKYAPVFGHLPGSQDGDMVFYIPPEGVRRGLSTTTEGALAANASAPTLIGRRTAVLDKGASAEIQKRVADAEAEAKASEQAQDWRKLLGWLSRLVSRR